jgi:hypothetical protein
VLDTLTEKDFQEVLKNGGDGGTGVYMRERTTSRMMATDRPYILDATSYPKLKA